MITGLRHKTRGWHLKLWYYAVRTNNLEETAVPEDSMGRPECSLALNKSWLPPNLVDENGAKDNYGGDID